MLQLVTQRIMLSSSRKIKFVSGTACNQCCWCLHFQHAPQIIMETYGLILHANDTTECTQPIIIV